MLFSYEVIQVYVIQQRDDKDKTSICQRAVQINFSILRSKIQPRYSLFEIEF